MSKPIFSASHHRQRRVGVLAYMISDTLLNIVVSVRWAMTSSDNGLLSVQHHAIICMNAALLPYCNLGLQ